MNTKDFRFFTIIFAILVSMAFTVFFNNMVIDEINKIKIECKCQNKLDVIPQLSLMNIIEDNEEIVEEIQWWTDYDLELLARTIYYEAGSDEILDEHQQLVAAVVMNRLNDERCPDTIYDVIMDDKHGIQYSTRYNIISDNQPEIPQRCYDNASVVLNGEIDYPYDLIYQSNFKQGYETWKTFETSYSTTYFCRG